MDAHGLPHGGNIGGRKAGCVFPLEVTRACVILYKGVAEQSPTEKTMEQLEQQNRRG